MGWTFEYGNGSYCDGSVENQAGTPVSPPGETGFWSETVTDPDAPMKLKLYDAFKLFELDTGDTDQADKTVAWIATQPYIVVGRNCMDDTYDVLRSFGVPNLPMPMLEITPNHWFDQLTPASEPVTTDALQKAGLLPAKAVMPERPPVAAEPEVPRWRAAGTKEWQELHEALYRPSLAARLAMRIGLPERPTGSQ
ncbi:MAG TPA: hypothetical protein VGG85_12295 [Terracidiphilus sp.]